METKLHKQTSSDNHTCHVRRNEAWVVHDLQNRRGIVWLKSGLIKSFSAIPERMIHVNQHVPAHGTFRINQGDFAREILRDFSPSVFFVCELLQRDAVRLV